jgi:hypothetical protein
MQAYAMYGDIIKRVYNLTIRMAAARGLPHTIEPLTPDADAMGALNEAEEKRAVAWESVLLLGDPETVAAARAWHQQIWRLIWFAQGRLTDAEEWQAALKETAEARDRFYHYARRDLGVTGRAVATPSQLPHWVPDMTSAGSPDN